MSRETADQYGWDGKRYWPMNTDPDICQCVMDHTTLREGGIDQCAGDRYAESNRFCYSCEETHGEAATERKAKASV